MGCLTAARYLLHSAADCSQSLQLSPSALRLLVRLPTYTSSEIRGGGEERTKKHRGGREKETETPNKERTDIVKDRYTEGKGEGER